MDRLRGMANSKALTLTIYATLVLGLLLSSLYVISSIFAGYRSSPFYSTSSTTTSNMDSLAMDYAPDVSNRTMEGKVVVPSPLSLSRRAKPIWEVPRPGTKMPPLESFQLTKELVEHRAKDNIIIVTFGNYAFIDFVMNWVKHLTDFGLSNILVGAMDNKILEALYWKGIPVFNMRSNVDTRDVGWGSAEFHKIGREKVMLVDEMLPFGFEILMCDTDTVWLKNPLPYFARFPGADVLTSTDQLVPSVTDDSLEIWHQAPAAYNIGLFYWRPTDSGKKLAKTWKDMLLADEKIWDQNCFNDLVKKQLGPAVDDEGGLVYAFDGNLKLGLLPASIFCSGHTYFVQAIHQQLRLEPYAVHTTFQYGGTEGKRHRLREAMMFYDEPEYYDSPGGFLSFKPSIPKSLLLDGKHNVDSHFSLVNYQIKQIRTALTIASLLNRTLVMPPLWCRLDRLWFPHPGVLEGTMTRQPFICPMDHIFEVNVMLRELPEEEFGPRINFREYSFLENPLLPKEIKDSWLDVKLCREGSQGCHLSNETTEQGVLKFPKGSNEATLKTVFSSFKNVKVIEFSSMQDAFGYFSDKVTEEKFKNRVKQYVGVWCCVENHIPGHIYYDMYWDENPNWKPIPPQTPMDDRPPWQRAP